jgi:hypothetical protein
VQTGQAGQTLLVVSEHASAWYCVAVHVEHVEHVPDVLSYFVLMGVTVEQLMQPTSLTPFPVTVLHTGTEPALHCAPQPVFKNVSLNAVLEGCNMWIGEIDNLLDYTHLG